MTTAQLREQSTRRLEYQADELDRIETAIVAAAKLGVELPSSDAIFSALNDASMASADVIDAHGVEPIPFDVRSGLLRLHCSVSDLVTSLRLYSGLEDPSEPTGPYSAISHRLCNPLQLH